MTHPKLVLVIGFGNLSAKLLPLRWTFPFLRFRFIEQHGAYFRSMREAFRKAGTLGDLLDAPEMHHPNLRAFADALNWTPNFDKAATDNRALQLATLFDEHIHYDGDLEGCGDSDFDYLRSRYQQLVRQLIEYDRSEVLLYLATRPDRYLESLKRYAPFADCVAIDKPLATDRHSLAQMRRFAQVNPGLTVLPIDHYLFKLDFTRFTTDMDRRGGLDPREIQKLEVTICEENLDEDRPYFRDTGIIRDMMPHVAAMVSFLFRTCRVTRAVVGNVAPTVHYYGLLSQELPLTSAGSETALAKTIPVIVQAQIELNYGTNDGYLPVSIRIAKGAKGSTKPQKEIIIVWHTGQRTSLDLTRKASGGEHVDWAGALKYLMKDWPLLEPMRGHFTFERACDITADVLECQEQADRKVPCHPDRQAPEHHNARPGQTFLCYPAPPIAPQTVFIFNFDGVVVNTEAAHEAAWKTWHKVIGQCVPNLMESPWYEPGKPNREMASKALAAIHQTDETHASFAIQYGERFYSVLAHIMREEKLQYLEASLPGKRGVASDYHRGVIQFLSLLRQYNQPLVLVTTYDALLVQKTLERLVQTDEGSAAVGFDRYYVNQRNVQDTYHKIIAEHQKARSDVTFAVFDDYVTSLNALRARLRGDRTVRLIHMDTTTTMRRPQTTDNVIESHVDFTKLYVEYSTAFNSRQPPSGKVSC
jgi:hypothetical protein